MPKNIGEVFQHKHMKNQQRIQHGKDYIKFLERRLASANFKKNSSPEEYAKTEQKLKKARLVFKVLEK